MISQWDSDIADIWKEYELTLDKELNMVYNEGTE